MNVRVTYPTLGSQLKRLAQLSGKELHVVLMEQGLLFAKDALKLTPPFGNAPIKESIDTQLTVGRVAIHRDLLGGRGGAWSDPKRGIFRSIPPAVAGSAEVSALSGMVKLFVRKDGTVYGTDRQLYRPGASMAEMRAHHQAHRRADGRVTSAGARSRDVGRWKFISQMVVNPGEIDSYLKQVYALVGTGKAGWIPAIKGLGAKLKASLGIKRIAGASVPRQLSKLRQSGRWRDGTSSQKPFVEVFNEVPYLQKQAAHILSRTWENRLRNLPKQIQEIERHIEKKLNATR